jgi:hypothetical protein
MDAEAFGKLYEDALSSDGMEGTGKNRLLIAGLEREGRLIL